MARAQRSGLRRPTISDIARVAGVSKASVSYALNGQPGVSADTRERVRAAASDLGWRPSAAARSLSNARANAVGLAVARDVRLLGEEPYYMRLLAGMESVLAAEGFSLLLTVVPDADAAVEVMRTWWAERRVDGVLLTDLLVDDPRTALVEELGIPCAPATDTDDSAEVGDGARAPVHATVEHLRAAGHVRLARVSGPEQFLHTRRRDEVWAEVTGRLLGAPAPVVRADYTGEGGLAAARRLLAQALPPSAVVFDNDVMAATVVSERRALGVRVPEDLAVVAWEDSVLCTLADPAISVMRRDVIADGAASARALLEVLAGRGDAVQPPPPPREFVARASTLGRR